MKRPMWLGWALVALVQLFAGVSQVPAEERDDEARPAWGGEIRFHAGSIGGDEGFGRSGDPFEVRFLLDAGLAPRLRAFADLGAGGGPGRGTGLDRLHLVYRVHEGSGLEARAGWIRLPFGRWDAVSLSRPLVKDRVFFHDSGSPFQIRRSSAGLGMRVSPRVWEMELAVVERAAAGSPGLSPAHGRDIGTRLGFRRHGLSVGTSYLRALGGDTVTRDGDTIDLGDVVSHGIDAEWSHGILTVGGEAILVDLDGRRSSGFYLQGIYDLSALVGGLRVLAKYDVLVDRSTGREERLRRFTLGARLSLRRDLDLEFEVDHDTGDPAVAFGGSHLILGLRYRF